MLKDGKTYGKKRKSIIFLPDKIGKFAEIFPKFHIFIRHEQFYQVETIYRDYRQIYNLI